MEMVLVGGDEGVTQSDDGGGCAVEFGFPFGGESGEFRSRRHSGLS